MAYIHGVLLFVCFSAVTQGYILPLDDDVSIVAYSSDVISLLNNHLVDKNELKKQIKDGVVKIDVEAPSGLSNDHKKDRRKISVENKLAEIDNNDSSGGTDSNSEESDSSRSSDENKSSDGNNKDSSESSNSSDSSDSSESSNSKVETSDEDSRSKDIDGESSSEDSDD